MRCSVSRLVAVPVISLLMSLGHSADQDVGINDVERNVARA